MIPRRAAGELRDRLAQFPAVALLGPRQIGKTTMARSIVDSTPNALYLDLERPADIRRLDDADAFLRSAAGRLLVLDEVHRVPGLFELLRGVIDDARRGGHDNGQFLLLGSASPALIGAASESLAGRLAYVDLGSIDPLEAEPAGVSVDTVWLRGGFPDSLCATDDAASLVWRENFIRSYLEREVPMFAPRLAAETMGRLWQMLAHVSAGPVNASRLAESLGVSGPTISRYLDLLVDLGLVRRLAPWFTNAGKRVTRTPKIYLRDSGLLHALLGIESMHDLLGHPVAGASYEALVVETLIGLVGPAWKPYYYRTADGAEIDLVFARGGDVSVGVEVKRSTAPVPSSGFYQSVQELGIEHAFIVYPGSEKFTLKNGVEVVPLGAVQCVASLMR